MGAWLFCPFAGGSSGFIGPCPFVVIGKGLCGPSLPLINRGFGMIRPFGGSWFGVGGIGLICPSIGVSGLGLFGPCKSVDGIGLIGPDLGDRGLGRGPLQIFADDVFYILKKKISSYWINLI